MTAVPDPLDLTTLADVKAWLQLGQSAFPPADDALLSRLITAVSQYIQTWLNRRIGQADYIETRDGTGGRQLQFAAFPVSAVRSLTIDGMPIPPSGSAGAAGYVFSQTQLSLRGHVFSRGAQNVVLIYTAGYGAIPPDIAQAATELVARHYRRRTRIGEDKETLGGQASSYATPEIGPAAAILQQYRAVAPVAFAPMLAATATDPALVAAAL